MTPADDQDICGFCDEPGADKVPAPRQWPGEADPGTPYVHADCETEECERAHAEFLRTHGQAGVDAMIREAIRLG